MARRSTARLGLDHVVGHQQHGVALVGEHAHGIPEQAAPHRIDIVGGLVEDDHAAGHDGRHGERDEPLDAAGELLAVGVEPLTDVQRLDEPLAARLHRGLAPPRSWPSRSMAWRGRQAVDGQLRLRLERADLAGAGRIGDEVDAVDVDGAASRAAAGPRPG